MQATRLASYHAQRSGSGIRGLRREREAVVRDTCEALGRGRDLEQPRGGSAHWKEHHVSQSLSRVALSKLSELRSHTQSLI